MHQAPIYSARAKKFSVESSTISSSFRLAAFYPQAPGGLKEKIDSRVTSQGHIHEPHTRLHRLRSGSWYCMHWPQHDPLRWACSSLLSINRESEKGPTVRAKNLDRPRANWRRKSNVGSVELPLIQTGKSLDRLKNQD
jgi:hypothetical protein